MRELKFRAWDKTHKKMLDRVLAGPGDPCSIVWDDERKEWLNFDEFCGNIMQFTGLKDKNNPSQDIYEGDIIDEKGRVRGNVYEQSPLHKRATDLIIEGFGTKTWCATYQKAVGRGCLDSK